MVLHHVKALLLQPLHLIKSGVFKVHPFRPHKSKRIESDITLCRDLIVELTDRTAAQISRILILSIGIPDLFVDLLEILIGNNRFAPQDQLSLIGYRKRNILKHSGIVGYYFSHFPVAAGHGFLKRTFPVRKNDRKAVQFP